MIYDELYSKSGKATLAIANEIQGMSPGSVFPTYRALSIHLSVGVGTVQSAIKTLTEIGAIKLRARGKMGTVLEHIDYKKLYALTEDLNIVTGCGPAPCSLKQKGFITGIYQCFFDCQKTMIMSYMRGSRNRRRLLDTRRIDFAVMSRLSAEKIRTMGSGQIIYSFDPGTYQDKYYMVSLKENPINEARNDISVGVDIYSYDHMSIVRTLFRNNSVVFHDWVYTKMIDKLVAKEIDAAIISGHILKERGGKYIDILNSVDLETLEDQKLLEVIDAAKSAAIVADGERKGKESLLYEVLSISKIISHQNKVLNGEFAPLE